MFSYSYRTSTQQEIEEIPKELKKEGIISFKYVEKMANDCVKIVNTMFGRQQIIDQGKMYMLLDNYVNFKLDIHGNYIIKVDEINNCWLITGTKE
jgi:mannitol/fructose-specific phosphotransferase system IIA component